MALKEVIDCRPYVNCVDRGRLIEIFRGDEEIRTILGGIRQVAIVNLSPGDRAGSHIHQAKKEILYVINGWVKAIFRDTATGERLNLHLDAGRKVSVMPGIEHVFINESDDDVALLEFASQPFDAKNPDAEKVDLI